MTQKQSKNYTDEQMDLAGILLNPNTSREEKWREAADLARELNPDIKKEQDIQIKACLDLRRTGMFSKKKSKVSGLRMTVSIPPMTFSVLSIVDPSLRNIDKGDWSTKNGSNEIALALEKTFPEYKVS